MSDKRRGRAGSGSAGLVLLQKCFVQVVRSRAAKNNRTIMMSGIIHISDNSSEYRNMSEIQQLIQISMN